MKTSFPSLILFILLSVYSFGQNNKSIPQGINYLKATAAINIQAKQLIKKEINNPEYILFNKYLYCGPNLWNYYKMNPKVAAIKAGNIDFQIPSSDGSLIIRKGKLIQNKKDFIILWNQIAKDINNSEFTIRKLNTEELEYYWSIVFFDIEEPIFVVENKRFKMIFDLRKENFRLQFIESIN